MKRLERALLLFFCLAGLLSVRAAAWGPPKVMDWEDFYALYQTAGSADSETHDLYLMGNVKLSGGVYELGQTDTAVRIIATEPYSFVAAGDATLTLNNPNLTVYAENHSMGPFIISGGCLNLRAGTIQTVNCPAILLMSDGTHLLTGEGISVNLSSACTECATTPVDLISFKITLVQSARSGLPPTRGGRSPRSFICHGVAFICERWRAP